MTTRQAGRKGGLKRGPTKARKTAAQAARRRGVMARRIRELEKAGGRLLAKLDCGEGDDITPEVDALREVLEAKP